MANGKNKTTRRQNGETQSKNHLFPKKFPQTSLTLFPQRIINNSSNGNEVAGTQFLRLFCFKLLFRQRRRTFFVKVFCKKVRRFLFLTSAGGVAGAGGNVISAPAGRGSGQDRSEARTWERGEGFPLLMYENFSFWRNYGFCYVDFWRKRF